jgi:hypothetical protein
MREYYAFNPRPPEQHEVTPAGDQMFQPPRPTSASVEGWLTTVMDPQSQDDLRTDLLSGSLRPTMAPQRPVRVDLSTATRVALTGAALLVAALLVYIGRGYIGWPAEVVGPTEVVEPVELTDPAEADDTIAAIPLTAVLPSQPSDAIPSAAPVTPLVSLAPISDAVIPVTSASSPPTEQPVAERQGGPANSTDSSFVASRSEPNESAEEITAQPGSEAMIEPNADIFAPDTGTDETQARADESPAAHAVANDQVADQSESVTASDQATTEPTTVATEASAAAQQDETTTITVSSAIQVDLRRPVDEQRGRGGADIEATGEGFKRAGQVLSKLSQPISNAGPGGGYFDHR